VGVVVSLTGSISQLGVAEANAVKMLANQVNQQGAIDGHPLQLTVLDDASTPDQAVKMARQLQQQKVPVMLGPTIAGACAAVMPLVESAGPVDYCFSPGITPKDNSYVWSAGAATSVMAQRTMQYWKAQGLSRIGIISTTDASGQDGAKVTRAAIQAAGGTIAADVTYAPDAVDVTSQLEQITASKPQAIVAWVSGTPAGVALKGIYQLGIDIPVMTTNANLSYAFAQRVADYTPKTLLTPAPQDFWWDQQPPGSPRYKLEQAYHDAYQQAYGEAPDMGASLGYDPMLIVVDALKHAGPDSAKLKSYLEGLAGFEGVEGTYSFSPTNHRGLTIDALAMVQFKGSKFVYAGK